jgi:hypothetical protein
VLDPARIQQLQQRVAKTRAALRKAQTALTRLRYGPGPDNTDPPIREITRADGQWPFLLIRSYMGDVGQRPIPNPGRRHWTLSPDIIITPAGPANEPRIVDRSGIDALGARDLWRVGLQLGVAYDVWVHVWNLGQTQASGVRVRVRTYRARSTPAEVEVPEVFLGGTALDLGDRLSEEAHRVVKATTFTATEAVWNIAAPGLVLAATADCISDPASGDLSQGGDRHSAHRGIFANLPGQ